MSLTHTLIRQQSRKDVILLTFNSHDS